MRSKVLTIGVVLVLIAALVGGAIWYVSVPHSAAEAFAFAEKAERALPAGKKPEEIKSQAQEVVKKFRAVGDFGKGDKHAEALERIAKIHEEKLKDDAAAIKTLDELAKAYPDENHAGAALLRIARIRQRQAEALKAADKTPDGRIAEETKKRFTDASDTYEDYRKAFPSGRRVDETLLETGRIWQLGIGSKNGPLIKAIDAYKAIIEKYPGSDYKPEAMYRLGQCYEEINEFRAALDIYGKLLEEFPRSPWSDKALFAHARLLRDKFDDPEKAAQEFDRLARDFPDSELANDAKAAAEKAREDATVKAGEEETKERYGGSVPVDTTADKPIPPHEELKRFAAQKLDAEHYELDVDIAPGDHRITVKGTLSLINRGDKKEEFILLMLANGLAIKKLQVDKADVKFAQEGDELKILLKEPIATAQKFTLAFEYSGQYAAPMPEFMDPEDAEEKVLDKKDAAKSGEKKLKLKAPPLKRKTGPGGFPINPQLAIGKSGYALSGAAWYPITIIGDLFAAQMTFHVPAGHEAVASGAMDKREVGKSGKPGEFVFRTTKPVFGLYFVYGEYKYQEKKIGGVTYSTYMRPANAHKSAAYIEVASRILTLYGEKFAPFPYEKMAIVETSLPPFLGGVGPSSMMMLSEKMMAAKDPPEFLLAHELAHQWFGNLIPINIADEGYSQWLSEGFATYCDALYTEHREGHDKFVKQLQKFAQTYFQFTSRFSREKPTVRTCMQTSPLYRPVVYEKGALVLHALRKVLGEEKFFKVMREYVQSCQNKQTTVADFEKLATAAYGKDLAWFFKQWLDEPSYAFWNIKDVQIDLPSPGRVTLQIEQPRDLIKMPVDITLFSAKGERHVIKDQMLDQKEQAVEMACPFRPTRIVIDEESWVLHHPGAGREWPAKAKPPLKGKPVAAATKPAVETAPEEK